MVDLTDFGEVIGMEILDWQRQVGASLPDVSPAADAIRSACDGAEELSARVLEEMTPISRPRRGAQRRARRRPLGVVGAV